jgi:acyl-CoA synthetase (AMP-forming)/AMP-acid ligase II
LGTKAARCSPDAPALIDAQRGTVRTFAELAGRVQCLAVSLRNMFGPGQRVAVLSRNCFEVVELYLACAASGSLLFPMNRELSVAQLRSALLEASPVAIFYDKTYQSIIDQLHSVVDARAWVSWEVGCESSYEELLSRVAGAGVDPGAGPAPGSGTLPEAGSLLHHPFLAICTAGRSGIPKSAVHSQFSYFACILNYLAAARVAPTDVYLLLGQLFHSVGYMPLAYLAMGRPVVIADFDAGEVMGVIRQEGVTGFFAMETMLPQLLRSVRGRSVRHPSLRQVEYGGAPTEVDVVREAAEVFGADLLRAWGMSEFGPGTYLQPHDHRAALAGMRPEILRSCGRSALLSTVALLDEDGRPVPTDSATVGEICHRGPGNMVGYWNDRKLSAAKLFGGWLHSGEFGTWDADGYVYLVERTKNWTPRKLHSAARPENQHVC